jgi:hypothetical protein
VPVRLEVVDNGGLRVQPEIGEQLGQRRAQHGVEFVRERERVVLGVPELLRADHVELAVVVRLDPAPALELPRGLLERLDHRRMSDEDVLADGAPADRERLIAIGPLPPAG